MVTYRTVPAKILTVDYLGVTSEQSEFYRKRAELELSKLEGQVGRGGLSVGDRRFDIGDNVVIECSVRHDLRTATVIIGAMVGSKITTQACYCCSPCLVAAVIIKIRDTEPEEKPVYETETDYFADVEVCQAPPGGSPKKITLYESRVSAGKEKSKSRVIQSQTYGAEVMYNVIFSDYQNHQVGDVVMVLVQPLFNFIPEKYGTYSPCINERRIADEAYEYPQLTTTAAFVGSSGMSCQITMDEKVWTYDKDESPDGDINLYPFRVLPIRINSCL